MLKEVKHKKSDDDAFKTGVDNRGFNSVNNINLELEATQTTKTAATAAIADKPHQNCLVDFFNPIVAIDCIKVIVRKRSNGGRRIVILLLCLYFFSIGPAFGNFDVF